MARVLTATRLFIVAAAIGLVFGLGFLLIPQQTVGLYDTTLNDAGEVTARLYGAALLALATIAWLGRDLLGAGARAIAAGALVGFAGTAVVAGWAYVAGIANVLALVNAVVFAVFAFAFGLLFRGSGTRESEGLGDRQRK